MKFSCFKKGYWLISKWTRWDPKTPQVCYYYFRWHPSWQWDLLCGARFSKHVLKRTGDTYRIEGRTPRSQAQIWQHKLSEWTGQMRTPFFSLSKIHLLLIYVYSQIQLWGKKGRRPHSRGRRWGRCPCSQRRETNLSPRSSGQGSIHHSWLCLPHIHISFACWPFFYLTYTIQEMHTKM